MGKNKFWELVAHTTCRSYGSSLRSAVVCRCSAAVVLVCTNQQTLSMPPASRCNSKVKQIKKKTYRGYILLSSIGCARCLCVVYHIQQMIVVGWLLENGHSADDEWQQSNGCSSKYKMSAGQCVWLALLVSKHTQLNDGQTDSATSDITTQGTKDTLSMTMMQWTVRLPLHDPNEYLYFKFAHSNTLVLMQLYLYFFYLLALLLLLFSCARRSFVRCYFERFFFVSFISILFSLGVLASVIRNEKQTWYAFILCYASALLGAIGEDTCTVALHNNDCYICAIHKTHATKNQRRQKTARDRKRERERDILLFIYE